MTVTDSAPTAPQNHASAPIHARPTRRASPPTDQHAPSPGPRSPYRRRRGGRSRCSSNYLNNRYQDPSTGVFLSVDPLVAKTGMPYVYGNGNPTTLADPLGLDPGWAHDDDPCNDNGYYQCGGSNGRQGTPTAAGPRQNKELSGHVVVGRLREALPTRYRPFLGTSDGVPDAKVSYNGRPVEPGERDLCASDRLTCVLSAGDLRTIKNVVEQSDVNTDSGDGTPGNARRHMLLAALLTWQFGEPRAREILEAHEDIRNGTLLPGADFDAYRQTDLINNEIGIGIARQMQQMGSSVPDALDPDGSFRFSEGLDALEPAVMANTTFVYFNTP